MKILIAFLEIVGLISARIGTIRSAWEIHELRLANAIMVAVMVLGMEGSAWPRSRTAGDALVRIRIVFMESVGIIPEKGRQDLCGKFMHFV